MLGFQSLRSQVYIIYIIGLAIDHVLVRRHHRIRNSSPLHSSDQNRLSTV